MNNLIKAEFIKLKKDKTILIAFILSMFFAITNTVILFMFDKLSTAAGMDSNLLSVEYSGRSVFLKGLSISGDFGLILPILVMIIVCKEFSYGTIRNKIITGHKKKNVYLSIVISSLIFGLGLYFIYILANLLLGSFLLGYGVPFSLKEFTFVLKTLGLSTLIYSVILTISVFIVMLIKSVGLSIVGFIVMILGLSGLSIMYMIPGSPSFVEKICSLNPIYQSSSIIAMNTTNEGIIVTFISSLVYLAVLLIGGTYLFKKVDLK